jgi:hypothetical protein
MLARRMLSFAAGILLTGAAVGCGRNVPTEQQAADYKMQAQPIIEVLEACYARHGKYPATIEELGMDHFKTPYGSSRYEVHRDGQMCQLIIGDPETEKNFNLHWTGMGKESPKFPQKWTWAVYP